MAAMSRFPLVFATTDTKQLKCAFACIMSMCCLGLIASQVSVWGKRSPRQPREGIDMQLKVADNATTREGIDIQLKVAESVPGEFQAMLQRKDEQIAKKDEQYRADLQKKDEQLLMQLTQLEVAESVRGEFQVMLQRKDEQLAKKDEQYRADLQKKDEQLLISLAKDDTTPTPSHAEQPVDELSPHIKQTVQQETSAGGSATSGRLFKGNPTREFHLASGEEPPQRPEPRAIGPSGCMSDKWAVVTTIFKPSKAMDKAAGLPGWCLAIVADKKTQDSLYAPLQQNERVVYLSVAAQENISGSGGRVGDFVRMLPWNHFARKNVGFLYAISRGAKLLFDFDDDNELKVPQPLPCDNVSAADCKELRVMALPSNTAAPEGGTAALPAYNPYPLMGASTNTSWPRGFPLHQIKSEASGWGVTLSAPAPPTTSIAVDQVGVVQMLADHDPDVDGIFRLTQKLPFRFREVGSQPSVLIPPGTYVPTNAQATLHTYAALWGTLLPITVHGRVSDIWRGYAAERIFADLGLSVVFTAPRVDQIRNPHDYLADMSAEQPLYFKSGELVKFLSSDWKDNATTLPGKLERLTIALYEREYIEIDDVVMQQKWIAALGEVGYQFPSLKERGKVEPRRHGQPPSVPPALVPIKKAAMELINKDFTFRQTQADESSARNNDTVKRAPPRLNKTPKDARLITIVAHSAEQASENWFPYATTAHACSDTCIVTLDKTAAPHADAFLMFARSYSLPDKKYANKPWIIFTRENPAYTSLMNDATAMAQFSYSSSARLDSDFPHPSWREPEDGGLGPSLLAPIPFAKRDPSPIFTANSNCETVRTEYQVELMKHIQVDAYGACASNMDDSTKKKIPTRYEAGFHEAAFEQQRSYKFTLVFMNADCEQWIDTRLLYALNAGSVPIFMGTDKVDDWLPGMEDSIIKVWDFASPKLLAEYVQKVADDEALYSKYLAWKTRGVVYKGSKMEKVTDNMHYWYCNLCDKVRENPKPQLGRIKAGMESFETDICSARKRADWLPVPKWYKDEEVQTELAMPPPPPPPPPETITTATLPTYDNGRRGPDWKGKIVSFVSSSQLQWPPAPPAPPFPSVEPIKVPSLNYEFPLCRWVDDGLGYPRVGPSGPKPVTDVGGFKTCLAKLVVLVKEGKIITSGDNGALLAPVTSGGMLRSLDDLDMFIAMDKGIASDGQQLCPEVDWGHHGTHFLPERSKVGDEEYRKQYIEFADRFCTCELGGAFLCPKQALDDQPTKETVGFGPGGDDSGGPTWDLRDDVKPAVRLDDDRGSSFWSMKYKYSSGYWVPASSGGKDLANNRLMQYATPGWRGNLYGSPSWIGDTVKWCKDMSPKAVRRGTLPMADLLSYIDRKIKEEKTNPNWLYRMLRSSPCFMVNTRNVLSYYCDYLDRCLEVRGNLTEEKKLYEEFHGVPLKSLDPKESVVQEQCLLEIAKEGCADGGSSSEGTVCEMLPADTVDKLKA